MATKKKKVIKKETQRVTSEENKLNINMLLLVYFSLFALVVLNFYTQHRG